MNREFLVEHRTTLRFGIIGAVVLAMLIPLAMVEGVTEERQAFFDMTLMDIGNAWGNAQNVAGPFLIVEEDHRYQVKNETGELVWREHTRERVFLPAELELDVAVEHQYRRRSIYEVPVYSARVHFRGSFPDLGGEFPDRPDVTVRLDRMRMATGISHAQAISTASALKMGDAEVPFRSGTGQPWIGSGMHAVLGDYVQGGPLTFEFELQLKGTRQLGFTPVGGTTTVEMTSSWPHPSFNGTYLPERYEVRDDGFTARWVVHELARDLPSSWRVDEKEVHLNDSYAWISLFQPVTEYTIIDRALKYGLLFIALTFLGFLCFEIRSALRFHPVQYGVVGIGLVLFYLALLSLSEHIDFAPSYLIATVLLTALISWYVWSMTSDLKLAGSMAVLVASLYGTLYVLLQLEAFALLMGTAVLFVGLAGLMVTTRSLTYHASTP